ncbi:MAG: CatB-related O-acetyltransferase [Pseudomonadota bacterium]
MPFPPPTDPLPLVLPDRTRFQRTVFLKAVIDHPNVVVGDFTYASDLDPPEDWLARLVPYIYPMSREKLVIGKFGQIAHGVRFITSTANHRYDGISSYPFAVFDGFGRDRPSLRTEAVDTMIGHDVWIGHGARIMPGARLGSGVIVGAGSVVTGEVPDYAIVAGNPARIVRMRFAQEDVARLLTLAWWDWPIDHILRHEEEICAANIDALEAVRPRK